MVPGVSSRSPSAGFHQGGVRRNLMSQGVKCVHVYTCGRRHRLCESSLCPSARLCEGPLQLKRVTFEELPRIH